MMRAILRACGRVLTTPAPDQATPLVLADDPLASLKHQRLAAEAAATKPTHAAPARMVKLEFHPEPSQTDSSDVPLPFRPEPSKANGLDVTVVVVAVAPPHRWWW